MAVGARADTASIAGAGVDRVRTARGYHEGARRVIDLFFTLGRRAEASLEGELVPMEDNRDNRWALALIWVPFLVAVAALSWTNACGDSTPSNPSETTAVAPEGDFVAGVTSTLSITTVPPPESPGTLIHGILLAYDQPCPQCTLIAPGGSALVWLNTELFAETPDGQIPISFDELNGALKPGQPLKIRVDSLENTTPVAQSVIVERRFATTGTIDRSSDDVLATGEFILTVTDERAGRVDIPYVVAADDPIIEGFEATARVYLSGVSDGGRLIAQLVRPDV